MNRWRQLPPAVTALPVSAALVAAEKDGRLKKNKDRATGATLERAAKTMETPPRAVKASKRDPERNADGERRYIYHITNYLKKGAAKNEKRRRPFSKIISIYDLNTSWRTTAAGWVGGRNFLRKSATTLQLVPIPYIQRHRH